MSTRMQSGPVATIVKVEKSYGVYSARDVAAIKEKLKEIDEKEELLKVVALPDLGRRVIAREARRRARIYINRF